MYARCYSYGDDMKPTLKTLEEMRHLSSKDIHPHNMNMVEEQIEKAEKVKCIFVASYLASVWSFLPVVAGPN